MATKTRPARKKSPSTEAPPPRRRAPRPFVGRNLRRIDDALAAIELVRTDAAKVNEAWSEELMDEICGARGRLIGCRDALAKAPADFALPKIAPLQPGDSVYFADAAKVNYLPLVGDDETKLHGIVLEIREAGTLVDLGDGVRAFVTARSHLRRVGGSPGLDSDDASFDTAA
jgi:hypothetical protein